MTGIIVNGAPRELSPAPSGTLLAALADDRLAAVLGGACGPCLC